MNCVSQASVGFGRRLAVISCARLCWICVRAALMAGLFVRAICSAWSRVISVAAGRSGRTAAVGGVGADVAGAEFCPPPAVPLPVDELTSIVGCPDANRGSMKHARKRDTRNIVPLQTEILWS